MSFVSRNVCVIVVILYLVDLSMQVKDDAVIPCSKSDPHLSACMKKATRQFLDSFVTEHPEYKMQLRDPMKVNEIHSKLGGNSLGLGFKFTDVLLYGQSKAKVEDLKVNLKKRELKCRASFPLLEIQAKYELSGKVLILPINGKGPANITITNAFINVTIKWEEEERDGKTYLKILPDIYRIKPGKFRFHFENLFNGDKTLGPQMNKFLNDNSKEIVVPLMPILQKVLSEQDVQELNNIMSTIPYDKLLLD